MGNQRSSRVRQSKAVPLNDDALFALRDCKDGHKSLVFTRVKAGAQIEHENRRAMGAALTIAGIEDFRFHDLRHTWASRHVQVGTPLFVLRELGEWQTIEMVKRYAHFDAGRLSQYADVVTF
jgi:integrase